LLIITVDPEVLLKGLVGAFGLSVAFRVVSRGKMKGHIQCFSEGMEEVGDELRAPVRCNMGWNSMLREYVSKEESREVRRSDSIVRRDEYGLLDKWSMTTRMAVKPDESRSCSMKSMEMEFQGFSGIGSCLSNL
jgi:hypothetical protein